MINLLFPNMDNLGVPLIDLDKLKKILFSQTKTSKKKRISKTAKKQVTKEQIFAKILEDLNVEPKPRSKKLSKKEAFTRLLEDLDSESDSSFDDVTKNDEELIERPKKKSSIESKDITIKIASKEIKDSHYQIDVSKDLVKKNGSKLIMVSAYFRDAYLGRYLIKRNFYYLPDNEEDADATYAEICKKMKMIKNNYYEGKITVKSISTDVYKVLQGIISDIKFDEEDELGTTVKR